MVKMSNNINNIYSVDQVMVSKKGSEVKEGIDNNILELIEKKVSFESCLVELVNEIGVVPDESNRISLYSPFSKRFSYSQISSSELKEKMSKYNNLAYDFNYICRQIATLKAARQGFDDKKEYQLSPSLIVDLKL